MEAYAQQLMTVRERLGKSQKEVAERLGVSPSLVSKWEKGERKPDDSQFWELGRFFGVTASFLQKQHPAVKFRPRTQIVRNSGEKVLFGSALNDAAQQIEHLHEAWDLAGRTPRRFAMALEYADTMLVQLADGVRKYLQLNEKITYSELRNALAEKDVLVFEWKLPPKLSGLSFQRDFSVIFINSQMPERVKLFTLCHELAHLLFHLRGDHQTEVSVMASRNDPYERQANHFAAELLMPSAKVEAIVKVYGSALRRKAEFCAAVEQFGVSHGALFYRLAQRPWSVVDYTMKSQLFMEKERSIVETAGARVTRLTDDGAEVAPEFLKVVLELWLAEKVSNGLVAQWCFAARSQMDAFLAGLMEPDQPVDDWDLGYAEVDDLVG